MSRAARRARRRAHSGRDWVRRQFELKRGARLWFTVDDERRTVTLIAVHTHHPNATK